MLSTLTVLFFASAVGVFFWTLRSRGFRRYPWEIFVLLGIAVSLGVLAAMARPSLLNWLLLAIAIVALAAALLYLGRGARFARGSVSLKAGERLPSFTLPDSTGELFHSDELEGKTAALYLFYRGDW
jgi:cytochrome oxidase Cu insertion factor (SCO1/SenC/PrrC family)